MSKVNISTTEVKEILENGGVKPSLQRISILKYLMEKKNHPSVDVIYKSLSDEIPTLSRMTVYNTLNLLTAKELVSALSISDNEVIYDYKEQKPHAHFLCSECGSIHDIFVDSELLTNRSIDGHIIKETQIQLKGICKDCSN